MGYPNTFTGYCVDSPLTWNEFHLAELKPKPFGDHDIDVQIDACGVCGSDVHTLTGGWGGFQGPLCVGHEIVGKAVKVGEHVKGVKEGDRVGVGAQIWSCLECDLCKSGNENYCLKLVDTYNSKYPDGSVAHGGFASHVRAHEYYTVKIPDKLPTNVVAPMLCAGITTYSPLVRAGVGPGKTVGVIGIGGLGHLAVQWAKALGAEVYAFTHSPSKLDDCKKLGAHDAILTNRDGWSDGWQMKFDFILNCSDVADKFDMRVYLSLLKPNGEFHMVGIGDHPLPEIPMGIFTHHGAKLGGSHVGNRQEMESMLQLAADKGVRAWVEELPISERGCKEAMEKVNENKVHYRFTMTEFDKAFGRA